MLGKDINKILIYKDYSLYIKRIRRLICSDHQMIILIDIVHKLSADFFIGEILVYRFV